MKILLAAAEAAPFVKTGGLGDVVGSLAHELAEAGHEVAVALPWYRSLITLRSPLLPYRSFSVGLGSARRRGRWYRTNMEEGQVAVYLADAPEWFDRSSVYGENGRGYEDNLERFARFSEAVTHLPASTGWHPDVVHAHDWHTSLVPLYWKAGGAPPVRHVLTIHNLAYQGIFPGDAFPVTGLPPEAMTASGLEFWGRVNCLKGGIRSADAVTTVSPAYREETLSPEGGLGLDGFLATRAAEGGYSGILNGVDTRVWNPLDDAWVEPPYGPASSGRKALHKIRLERFLGLDADIEAPLAVMITRLTSQKGCDLVMDAVPELLSEDLRLVVLGMGDPGLEAEWLALARDRPKRLHVQLGFHEGLAHRLYASADLLLMPSRFEPCGLSQLIAFRYGTVPVVTAVGGLKDTVAPHDPATGEGTGFVSEAVTSAAFAAAVKRALAVYRRPDCWRRLVRRAMEVDVSWGGRVASYEAVYRRGRMEPTPNVLEGGALCLK